MTDFASERFMSLQTFRSSGEPVSTPVWFAADGSSFVVGTHSDSGKVRRILEEPRVRFAAANYRGLEKTDYSDGTASLVDDARRPAAEAALATKYGWEWGPFSRGIDCYLRISPD